jgi:hypothetical protein
MKTQRALNFTIRGYTVRCDCLCDPVVSVPCYRSRGPGSISGATRFSEKQWVWNGVHSASWVQLRSYLEENVSAPVLNVENTAVGDPLRYATPFYPQKLAPTSPTRCDRSVGIVRSRTQATELHSETLRFYKVLSKDSFSVNRSAHQNRDPTPFIQYSRPCCTRTIQTIYPWHQRPWPRILWESGQKATMSLKWRSLLHL